MAQKKENAQKIRSMRSTASPRKTQGSAGLIHVMKDSSCSRMVHAMIMREDKEMERYVGPIGAINFRSYYLMVLVRHVRPILELREMGSSVDQICATIDKNYWQMEVVRIVWILQGHQWMGLIVLLMSVDH